MKKIILSSLIFWAFPGFAQDSNNFIVHFEFNKYILTSEAKASLDHLIEQGKNLQDVVSIQLNGHCDYIGNDAYNDKLSQQRVAAVKNYLSPHFTAKVFTSAIGHGKRKPLNSNATDEERLLNRRVEILVTVAAPKDTSIPERKLSERIADTATKLGSNLVLKNINFVGARHQLLPESFPVLTELLKVMKDNPNLKIEVQGHICCLPGDVDGLDEETGTNDLSQQRAKAIMEYLIKNGIAINRLSYVGLGHNHPLYAYPEKNEQEKTLNRRVEIKIISK